MPSVRHARTGRSLTCVALALCKVAGEPATDGDVESEEAEPTGKRARTTAPTTLPQELQEFVTKSRGNQSVASLLRFRSKHKI